MSRERFIDPCIWSSKQICQVNRDARELFIGMITKSDDWGFFSADPHTLRLEIFPNDTDINNETVEAWRDSVLEVGLAEIYESNGKHYLWIPTFEHWQKLRYRARSRILDALVHDGQFGQETGKTGRPERCWSKSKPSTDFMSTRKPASFSGVAENVGSRAVPCRAVSNAVPDADASTPPLEATPKPTTGFAHGRVSGNGKPTAPMTKASLLDVTPETRAIISEWPSSDETSFRNEDSLINTVVSHDRADPVRLLAIIHEVDGAAVQSKRSTLYRRFYPRNGQERKDPSGPSIEWAKSKLNGALGKKGQPVKLSAVKLDDALKPAAAKKRGKQ